MSEIVCYCKNVSKSEIDKAIEEGANSIKMIQEKTGACTGNKCKELNSAGVCCSTVILEMISKKLGMKNNDSSNSCCCC